MVDWTAVAALTGVVLAFLAIGGALVGYGVYRQKVADLEERMNTQDTRIDKLDAAVGEAIKTRGEVQLLNETMRGFKEATGLRQEAVLQEVKHLGEMWGERFNGVIRAAARGGAARTKTG